ncbi:MAG TPA: hypothetical protein VMV19_17675 [Xanthobacteraceae bacterium]|nr:hypothetical protein [Xanthobacteraceae bacterium]
MDEEFLTGEELKRAVQKVFKLSQTDLKFRALCLADPNEAIRLIAGKAVQRDIQIQFLDSQSDKANESVT